MENRMKTKKKRGRAGQHKAKQRGAGHLLRLTTNMLITVVAALFLVNYAASPLRQEGYSMEPGIKAQSVVLINRLQYRLREPQRFDVAAYSLDGEKKLQIKRIVGLPGEEIQIKGGVLYINGTAIDFPQDMGTIEIAGRAKEPILLGEDEYFVLGDNPSRSQDSRFENTGNIKREQLAGKAWFWADSVLEFGFLTGN